MAQRTVTALGLMSGTSMDGIDVALLDTDGRAVVVPGPWATFPYEAKVRRALAAAVRDPDGADAGALIALESAVRDAHAAAVEAFLADTGTPRRAIAVVGCHGHTLLHRPQLGVTRQIGGGQALAARLGLDVVDDFRAADVAAGGQGAPFAPLYHAALAGGLERPLAVLNVGGVANVTWIGGDAGPGSGIPGGGSGDGRTGSPEAGLLAFDTGPGNALVDDWVAAQTGQPYDADGALAARGRVDEAALAALLDHPYFDREPPKSLDRGDFDPAPAAGLGPADGAATLTLFTAEAIARARRHLPRPPRRWLVTGGGRHNRTLMALLRARLGVPVDPVEAAGWQGDALEAQAFAYLAVRSLHRLPLSLPGTTGVPRPMTGGTLHPARRTAPGMRG